MRYTLGRVQRPQALPPAFIAGCLAIFLLTKGGESQAFRLGCQSTSLVVVESHSSISELLAQYPVLLTQVLNHLHLTLIHPTSQRDQHELDWIKDSRHLVCSLSQPSSPCPQPMPTLRR